jgi:uncharacterized protein YcbK (DUF882 family)
MTEKASIGGERNRTTRRVALVSSIAALAVPAFMLGRAALRPRRIALGRVATEEYIQIEYFDGLRYVPAAMARISQFLGDPQAKAAGPIDPALIDLLYDLTRAVHRAGYPDSTLLVHAAFLHPDTLWKHGAHEPNAMAALHAQGRAADVSVAGFSGMELLNIGAAAINGGIGYSGRHDMVHVDTGKKQRWPSAA